MGRFRVFLFNMVVVKRSGQHEVLPCDETLVSSHANMMGSKNSFFSSLIRFWYASWYRCPEFIVLKIRLGALYLPKGSLGFISRLEMFSKRNLSLSNDNSWVLKSNTVICTRWGLLAVGNSTSTWCGLHLCICGIQFSN